MAGLHVAQQFRIQVPDKIGITLLTIQKCAKLYTRIQASCIQKGLSYDQAKFNKALVMMPRMAVLRNLVVAWTMAILEL